MGCHDSCRPRYRCEGMQRLVPCSCVFSSERHERCLSAEYQTTKRHRNRAFQFVGVETSNHRLEAQGLNTKRSKVSHSNQQQSLWQDVECLTPETSLVPVLRIGAMSRMRDESLDENVHKMAHGSQSDRLSARRQSGPTGN